MRVWLPTTSFQHNVCALVVLCRALRQTYTTLLSILFEYLRVSLFDKSTFALHGGAVSQSEAWQTGT